MFFRQMRIPLSGLHIHMAQETLETPNIPDLDHVPGCKRMSEIMEADSRNPGSFDHILKVPCGQASRSNVFAQRGNENRLLVGTISDRVSKRLFQIRRRVQRNESLRLAFCRPVTFFSV